MGNFCCKNNETYIIERRVILDPRQVPFLTQKYNKGTFYFSHDKEQ